MNRTFRNFLITLRELRPFLILWLTQSFSDLGSMVTSYALVLWSYQRQGSALVTAGLMISSYTPYVACSIFAGALSDRWDKRKTMLVCDALAACTTVMTLILLKTGCLAVWHLYLINGLNGLMNTVQQPASEVATTALAPEKHYQRISALGQLTRSVNGIMQPVIATAIMTLLGMDAVIIFDLLTFAAAFLVLLLFIRIPETKKPDSAPEPLLRSVREGLSFLNEQRGVLMLVLFLAAINLVASMYNAALPALILPQKGEAALGLVNLVTGVAMLCGSIAAMVLPKPQSRVRVVCLALLISMSTENFSLAFSRSVAVWCVGAVCGWLTIPVMSTNLNAAMRSNIPREMQGRVYAARNSLQFFTIPLGYFLGGWLVDRVFEPLMAAAQSPALRMLFGAGKGSGAAMCFAFQALAGVLVCIVFMRSRPIRTMIHQELKQ